MDAWIAMMQEWLDDTYGGRFGYTPRLATVELAGRRCIP